MFLELRLVGQHSRDGSGRPDPRTRQHALGWQHFVERLVVVGAGGDTGRDAWAPTQ